MRLAKLQLLLFAFVLPIFCFGQDSKEQKLRPRKQAVLSAKQHIEYAYDGGLMVRLNTKEKSVAALRLMGKEMKAEKLAIKQNELNREIIKAFHKHFDFCPTYFFYSQYSENIKKRELDKVQFLNEQLQVDDKIVPLSSNFLIGEIARIEQDTTSYYKGYYDVQTEDGLEKRTRYYSSPDMGFEAFIIKSDQFVQLRNPFPNYVRTFTSLPINRSPKRLAKKTNKRLKRFYKYYYD